MATGSDNDLAEVTEEMTLEKFKMWTTESLRTYSSLRNKSKEGDFETLVYKLVLVNEDIISILICKAVASIT